MKTIAVTLREVDDEEAEALKRNAYTERRLPIVGVLTDDVGKSLWVGDEFLKIATEYLLDGDIKNNRFIFVLGR